MISTMMKNNIVLWERGTRGGDLVYRFQDGTLEEVTLSQDLKDVCSIIKMCVWFLF